MTRFGNAILVVVSLLFCIGCSELILRFTDFKYLTFSSYSQLPKGYFQRDAVLGADHARNFPTDMFYFKGPEHEVFTNSLGCFDVHEDIDEGYILVIGDSAAWGYTPLEDMWTSHLERILRKQVLKCGVSGTGPKFQSIKARLVMDELDVQPSMVIVLYTAENDFNDDVVFPGYTVVDGERVNTLKQLDLGTGHITRYERSELEEKHRSISSAPKTIRRTLRESFVVAALLEYALRRAKAAMSVKDDRQSGDEGRVLTKRYQKNLVDLDFTRYLWLEDEFKDHIENLRSLEHLATERGATFVLFSAAVEKTGHRAALWNVLSEEFSYYYDTTAYVLTNSEGRATNHMFDGHWNAFGNRLAADGMYNYLTKMSLVEEPLKDISK